MNGVFFDSPSFPAKDNKIGEFFTIKQNKNKKVKVYTSFSEANNQLKVFSGILEDVNDTSLILSDPTNGNYYLLALKHVNYFEFEEKINF